MASCIITVVSLAFILSLRMNHKWAIFKPETERDKSITAFAWAHLRVSPNLFLYIYIYIFFFFFLRRNNLDFHYKISRNQLQV